MSAEIAETRGVQMGRDCVSPSRHAEFDDVDSMLDFVELLASERGLPVGIKSAVGDEAFWTELVSRMSSSGRGVDFVTIDGGEGGTGASPLIFTDSVAKPFRMGFSHVYSMFDEAGLTRDVTFVRAGKLGHTDTCPTGVATQNAWLAGVLDPALKSVRAATYIKALRRDLLKVSEACGVERGAPCPHRHRGRRDPLRARRRASSPQGLRLSAGP